MATLSLTWKDLNLNEDGFRVYRSETPMDVGTMPSPIATLPANTGSYDDTTGVNGTFYYYRIGVFRGTEEKISGEFSRVFGDTSVINDVFGDGSVVATYNLDGDATDLGGNYNGMWSGTELYSAGVIGQQAASFDGTNYIQASTDAYAISFWVKISTLDQNMQIISLNSFEIFKRPNENKINIIPHESSPPAATRVAEFEWVANEWIHIVIDRQQNIWRNGVKLGDFGIGENANGGNLTGLKIGGTLVAYSTYWFNGSIDQVRIYDRVLSQLEIDILYQEGL